MNDIVSKNPTVKANTASKVDTRLSRTKNTDKPWPAGSPPERVTRPKATAPAKTVAKKTKNPKANMTPITEEVDPQIETCYCLSCEGVVDDKRKTAESIECDYCKGWVHARNMCSGLSVEAYKVLSENENLMYKCSKCLTMKNATGTGSPGDSNGGVSRCELAQISEMVRGLCTQVNKVMEDKSYASATSKPNSRTVPHQPDSKEIRKIIREETQDRLDRERRKEFLIVKGFTVDESDTDCAALISEVFEVLAGKEVTFSDFLRFDKRQDLVRVKILNERDRRLLLSNASELQNTDKSRFFVRRDLTYLQRQELRERYEQRQKEQGAEKGKNQPRLTRTQRDNIANPTEPTESHSNEEQKNE